MRIFKKYWISAVAFVLTLIVGACYVIGGFFMKKETTLSANVRTVSLVENEVDYQSVLNEFEDGELTKAGALTTFTGGQMLDASVFEEFDNVSESDLETLSDCKVSYKFTYDSESNIVTIFAELINENGEMELDEISGVGFINDAGEINAVMNVDGEGILLSEMREAGLIENCGWFSRAIRKATNFVKKNVVAVVTTAVVAVATVTVMVATAGLAAPALMAAGVGVVTSSALGAAAGLAAGALFFSTLGVSAIQAGIKIDAAMWRKFYPGIEVEERNNISYATEWNQATKQAIADIVTVNKKNGKEPRIYFECEANSNRPYKINLMNVHTLNEMASIMKTTGKSSLTYMKLDAKEVIRFAIPQEYPIFYDEPNTGCPHWQAIDIYSSGYSSQRAYNENPRYKVQGRVLHSFWTII